MATNAVIKAIETYLHVLQREGIPIECGILFGSHARDQAHQWSDIDLLVLSPRFDSPIKRTDIEQLWKLTARSDVRIEPIPCGVHQWNTDDSSMIIEIARQEGQKIYP